MFFMEWEDKRFFLKQFFSGIFIAIVMTGLDQDMMQKNLSCKNIKDAQKNMYWMSGSLIVVNFLFLMLGAILYLFIENKGIVIGGTTDELFPGVALQHLSPVAGVVFIIGLIAAAYSSADSALTSLTTSFSVDILGIQKKSHLTEKSKIRTRYIVHICFSILLLSVIVFFRQINDKSVISQLFTIAGYTYGPLLGLYSFGLFTKLMIRDKWVPVVAFLSPLACYVLSVNSKEWFFSYEFGFELLILNGVITFIGLLLLSRK
jgi:Na+/proline symporter